MTAIRCKGFQAAGIHSGLKANGDSDLGLIYSETPATSAGVFTQNSIKAAPVLVNQKRIKSGLANAIIVNSGNANCCNGQDGYQSALDMSGVAAQGLGLADKDVLVASTGVIGERFPIEKVANAVPNLIKALKPDGFMACAEAIMTTDTVPKLEHRQGRFENLTYNLVGMAKGSGMIAPNMATMLCFICTDISMPQALLHELLVSEVDKTLNRICIDGDTSTNDTTLILANGQSNVAIESMDQAGEFQILLGQVLGSLAKRLVKDGEGVTKCVEILVKGAMNDPDAHTIANTIATSPLVKTALFGEDANWGRFIAAAGRAGVPIDPDHIDIYFNQIQMTRNSLGCGPEAEKLATRVLQEPAFTIVMDLNMGPGSSSVLTCDFTIDYIKINADYRS
jgi:glutamate N-acetyltransferase / amino-acid N-acetyltransferase